MTPSNSLQLSGQSEPKAGERLEDCLKSVEFILFDCDGVLWHENAIFERVPETLSYLRSIGKKLLFITNNSTMSRQEYLCKFERLGVANVKLVYLCFADVLTTTISPQEDIVCSAYLVAKYLKLLGFSSTDMVYVVGENGIHAELGLQGISSRGMEDAHHDYDFDQILQDGSLEPANTLTKKAVVVGFDQYFNYSKLAKAHQLLKDPACLFLITNADPLLPSPAGTLPGTGCFVAAIQECAGRTPIILGKPELDGFNVLVETLEGFAADKALMIGDNLQTDILFGNRAGMRTLLVETGVHRMKDAINLANSAKPHYGLAKLSSLMDVLP